MTDCSAELAQVHGEEVAGEDAGADEGLVLAGEAAEDEVDSVVLAGVGEADELGDVAVGDADAVDGLGGVERGVDIEEAAVGGPDGVGAGRDGQGGPGAGGDVEEADLALVEREGGDPAAVGRPARAEEVVGAGDFFDLIGVEVEDVQSARGVLFAHVVVDAAEDE